MSSETKQRCNRCKVTLPIEHFKVKRCGTTMKCCIQCNDKATITRNKSKCLHNNQKGLCKLCKGSQICLHDRRRARCKECKGNQICEHNREKSVCKLCNGNQICLHDRRRTCCKECNPQGYITSITGNRIVRAIKRGTPRGKIEHLNCDIKEYKQYIQEEFEEGMSWDNYGKWYIGHITPIKYDNPTLEEVVERLHYTNTQPMWTRKQ